MNVGCCQGAVVVVVVLLLLVALPLWSLQSCSPSLRLLTAFATDENDGERTRDQSCELAQLLHNLSQLLWFAQSLLCASLLLVKVNKMIV
ncbi:hypothetical protein MUK42_32693 [Musa troglodytarum]|uniref:Uncharacterized protein n=1 Tax=Musa troglodytarum TaxID=320322 RepID=A0A9E7FCH2_9LILI|nr:hypothetical protein MUK42_32693 [Musa troglodytarum]URD93442.1 hypothetical protein MUK42_32693 [Musa troglodytarum]URD93443.1 hypothetical protein MUK42_32693 [Musa troglodytarum]URD93444.1 hypothetical protein MUK42_32693 [Musa troglodytarum]